MVSSAEQGRTSNPPRCVEHLLNQVNQVGKWGEGRE